MVLKDKTTLFFFACPHPFAKNTESKKTINVPFRKKTLVKNLHKLFLSTNFKQRCFLQELMFFLNESIFLKRFQNFFTLSAEIKKKKWFSTNLIQKWLWRFCLKHRQKQPFWNKNVFVSKFSLSKCAFLCFSKFY